ncbi:MAG: transporter substrate-binding domain-containing protein [Clostridia bacterium]|nr:transporter substrate-binding domain-containing protein [Clostridia bacterium]
MKKFLLAALALVMMLTCFTACGGQSDLAYVEDNGKLTIGITIYSPMNYYDDNGDLIGFDTEFAKAVCAKLGVEPDFKVIDWKNKETELKAKNIDAIWNGLTVTEERRENMDFSTSYLINKQCIVIKKEDAEKYTSTESLKDALLTAEAESAGETAIKADKNLKNATYNPSDSQQNAFVALLAGNVDAIVVDYTMAKSTCGSGDYKDFVMIEGIELTQEEYAIGFRVGSDMTAKVNKIIEELVADGTLKKIAEKYDLTDLYEEALGK